jgi:hypothetical protein
VRVALTEGYSRAFVVAGLLALAAGVAALALPRVSRKPEPLPAQPAVPTQPEEAIPAGTVDR